MGLRAFIYSILFLRIMIEVEPLCECMSLFNILFLFSCLVVCLFLRLVSGEGVALYLSLIYIALSHLIMVRSYIHNTKSYILLCTIHVHLIYMYLFLFSTLGIPSSLDCDNNPHSSTGLWFDVLTFILVTIQIILLDTQYADQVEREINEKESSAVK